MSDFVEDGLREHQATNDVMLGLLSASQRQQNLKQQHAQTQELQPHMKPLPLLALTLGFILCTMGCSPDRKALAEKQAAEAKVIAEAKVTAEAKALAEKRLEWTGKAMQRAGMKAETVKRTLTQGGTVVAWGSETFGKTRVPAGLSGVVAIAAGDRHTVALKQDGTVVAWGKNDDGQTTVPAGLSGVVAIAAGRDHTVALRLD